MSSYTGYNRRPTYSNTGYYPSDGYDQSSYRNSDSRITRAGNYDRGRHRVGSGQSYNYSNYNGYNTNYDDDYEDDHTRPYGPRSRNSSFTQTYPDSPLATYSNVLPSASGSQYYTGGQQYPTRSSRRDPIVVSGDAVTYSARPAVRYIEPNSNSGYRAQGERGETIPISNGMSYYEEGISLSTWMRRLFGLGPRRSGNHVGRSVHVKRWDLGRAWFSAWPGRSNASVYTI